jgi:hypothetical protein
MSVVLTRDEMHRWCFEKRDGKEMRFSQKSMPFAVFRENAVWGGVCEIGDIKCRIRIRHNSEGEKGKRLEVWFPDQELGKEVPFEESTLVGYMLIQGSFQKGNGKCVFRRIENGR